MAFDLAQIQSGIKALSAVNFSGAVSAFETANAAGEIQTAVQVANLVAQFVPQAIYVKDALVAVQFLMEMQQKDWIAPADPQTDQTMINAAGHGGIGRNHA